MGRKEYLSKSFVFEGKRYYIYAKTQKELESKIIEKKIALKEHKIKESNLTVKEWSYKAVESYKTNQKPITRKKYIARLNHCVIQNIGHLKLKEVKPIDVQNCLNLQQGNSKTQINEVYGQLKLIFDTAEQNELIEKSPARYLVKPIGTRTTRREITEEEKKHLLLVAEKDHRFDIYLFSLYCGCRPSEARDLKHEDLLLIKGKKMLKIIGSKNETTGRTVPCPSSLWDRYKEGTGYIFLDQYKKPYNEKSYQILSHKLYREMNISMGVPTYDRKLIPPLKLAADFCPYCLRHTYCTELVRANIPIAIVSKLMGHTSIKTTSYYYTHIELDDIVNIADMVCE